MKRLPISVDNFHKLVSNDCLFCDKTAMMAELLSKGDEVTLITRPLRWGKTLKYVYIAAFFCIRSEWNKYSRSLFDDLVIGKLDGGKYLKPTSR